MHIPAALLRNFVPVPIPWLSVLTLGTFSLMDVRAVGAIDIAAQVTFDFVRVLAVICPIDFKSALAHLVVPVSKTDFC